MSAQQFTFDFKYDAKLLPKCAKFCAIDIIAKILE